MTKRCLAWREHGFGRAARSRRPTITISLSTRRRAVAGSRRLSWRRRIWLLSPPRSSWWPTAKATYIPCSHEDPRRSTSWCAHPTTACWLRAVRYSRHRQPGRRLGRVQIKIAPKRPGDKGRKARIVLKARTVTIKRPNSTPDRRDATKLTLGLVEVREEAAPARVEPLLWRLLTTLPVVTRAHALEVVRLYRLRWRIEEVFRILKSNGLKIEDSQLETADRLLNLAAFGLVAAARIIQLVDARDGSTRPATDVIEADEIKAAAAISATLEGGTERQKNPHKQGTLAWLSWIAARLGGWNCYYKPPGPKTMARGLDRLIDRIEGFRLANERRNV